MTEDQLRRTLNMLLDGEVDQIHPNTIRMGEGRTLTIHAGGQLVLTDVVSLDIFLAHSEGIPLARAETTSGGTSVLLMPSIYSVAVVVAA